MKEASQYFEEAYHQYDIKTDKLTCNYIHQLLISERCTPSEYLNNFDILESRNVEILNKGFPVKEVEDFSGKYIIEEYKQEKNLIWTKIKKGIENKTKL